VPVSNRKEIIVGRYDRPLSSETSLMETKKMLAGFALAVALSMPLWLAIIGGAYWMM
jgi:hypothetical protein